MTLPLIPTYILAITCLSAVLLAIPALRRLPEYSKEELIMLFAGGIIYLAAGLLVFGGMYFYYTTVITDINIRQSSIRFAIMFLALIINFWFLIIILFKKGNT